ncbi:DUF4158 domain-containing protein [Nonomuraea sp. NPDC046570]|uniref:DUF4158 domain-containing protein n=1 Tax=Nonomuraea sp. NPDC046570 TaxID=3155255 RepID=UPI0033EF05BF
MTSVERTAYRVFPRLMMTRELYLFYSPSQEELAWAREKTDTDEHLLALTLALKCFQRLGRFAKAREMPPVVVEHVPARTGRTRSEPRRSAAVSRRTWSRPVMTTYAPSSRSPPGPDLMAGTGRSRAGK